MTWGLRERPGLRRVAFALLVVALWHAASVSSAQPSSREGLGLNWVRLPGAEQCIASGELMNRIEEHAERILFVRAGDAFLTLDGYVRPVSTPVGWAVTFEVSDADGKVLGRRELPLLEGSDCSVVESAADLIFDLTLARGGLLDSDIPLEPHTQQLLEELLHGEPSELDPSELPKAVPFIPAKAKPVPRQSFDAPPAAEADDPDEESAALDIAGVAMLGSLPGIAPGVALRLAIPMGSGWGLELGVLTVPEQIARATSSEGRGQASFDMQGISLQVCPPRFARALFLCGGAEYGRQAVASSGFRGLRDVPGRDLFNLVAEATLRIPLFSRVFVRTSLAGLVPLIRHDYVYDSRAGDSRIFRTAPVGGRAELGLGLDI